MPDRALPFPDSPRAAGQPSPITSAVGLEESSGRLRARQSSLFTRTMIWVTVLVCLAFLLGSLAQAWSNSQQIQDLQRAQQATQQLQREHDSLVQQARYYQDPYVIESEARQQQDYARPGEHVVVVIGTNGQAQAQPSARSTPALSPGFWQEWWNLFFGHG